MDRELLDRLDKEVLLLMKEERWGRACEAILGVMEGEIRRYLFAVSQRHHLLDDLYQDVVEKLLKGLPSFRGESTVGNWVLAVTRNVALDRNKRYSHQHLVRLETAAAERLDRGGPRAGTRLGNQTALEQAMERLTPEQREVVYLRLVKQLSFKDIVEVMGLTSRTAARKRYERARLRMKEILADLEATPKG